MGRSQRHKSLYEGRDSSGRQDVRIPQIDIGAPMTVPTAAAVNTAIRSLVPSGGKAPYTYTLPNNGGGKIKFGAGGSANQLQVAAAVGSAGVKISITVEVTDANGIKNLQYFTITVV